MWNARLDEAQAGIKIARRNINNLIYADDTTLMAESKEELKSLLMQVKEESEKAGLKLNHSPPSEGRRRTLGSFHELCVAAVWTRSAIWLFLANKLYTKQLRGMEVCSGECVVPPCVLLDNQIDVSSLAKI